MSLGGVYSDSYKDMYKDSYLHEAAQTGSRLEQVGVKEMMEGNKTFFQKLGKATHRVKSSRLQAREYADQTHERRQVQGVMAEYSTALDVEDLIKQVANPQSDLVQLAVQELGRRKDEIIMEAIRGTAVVTTDGSTANQALTLSVAVDNHTYDSDTGDVGLTVGKLKRAKREIAEAYGSQGINGRLICIAPSKQILNVSQENQMVSGDFRGSRPLEGPGVVQGLSGYLGIDFIEYEDVGVDASSDERVMLLSGDAVRIGVFQPLQVDIFEDKKIMGSPTALAVWDQIGASRMYEEKVCEILCDPLA